jgi:hypothetical protein
MSVTGNVHRTGPLPLAADYSKPLLQALVIDGDDGVSPGIPIGTVSRVQLLLTTLVERVHDAIYVLPRHARDSAMGTNLTDGPGPNPDEYAHDIVLALKGLERFALDLPNDLISDDEYDSRLKELNDELAKVRIENQDWLARGREAHIELQKRLDETLVNS